MTQPRPDVEDGVAEARETFWTNIGLGRGRMPGDEQELDTLLLVAETASPARIEALEGAAGTLYDEIMNYLVDLPLNSYPHSLVDAAHAFENVRAALRGEPSQ